jgi:hypothetical protein
MPYSSCLGYSYPLPQYPWMGGDLCCAGRLEDALGLGHLVAGAVSYHEELSDLSAVAYCMIPVFGNADAVQPGVPRAG